MGTRDHSKLFNRYMLDANIGLEKESLRVNADGRLALTPHPFGGNPHLDRDFSENQVEFITDIYDTPSAVVKALTDLHAEATNTLLDLPTGSEYLWPFSNPPYIEDDTENVPAEFFGDNEWKTYYRRHLRERYGTRLMLYSGIHFNFSFTDEFLDEFGGDRSDAYLNLSAWATRYAWLVVYLFAASPVLDPSFFETEAEATEHLHRYASPRSSFIGYWNTFDPVLDYSNLENYIDSIVRYVEDGTLMYPAELYYPVRLKPAGRYDMDSLKENGVNHIEIRVVDENPYSPIGILKEDLQFLHLLLVYLMYREKQDFTPEAQVNAIHDMKRAAYYDDSELLSNGRSVRDNALSAIRDVDGFFRKCPLSRIEKAYVRETIEFQKQKFLPGQRYAEVIRRDFGENYNARGLTLAMQHAETLTDTR